MLALYLPSAPPACLTLLFSNKTLSQLTLYPPSLQTTPLLVEGGSPGIHNQLTLNQRSRDMDKNHFPCDASIVKLFLILQFGPRAFIRLV